MPSMLPSAGLSGTDLKRIAMLSMLIDHIGVIFFSEAGAVPLRIIGRLAFPLYAFLLTEGSLHTRSTARYLGRLFFFALLSECPYDLAFSHTPIHLGDNSVMVTLFLGLAMLSLQKHLSPVWRLPAAAAFSLLAEFMRCDEGASGILLIYCFAAFREDIRKRDLTAGILSALSSFSLYGTAALSLLPIHAYNRRRGLTRHPLLYYAFYPAHLLALYLIHQLLNVIR